MLIMPKKTRNARRKMTRQELRGLDLEIGFMEGVIRRDPGYIEALQILGDDYTRRDRFADGLRIDQRLVQLRPRDPLAHYNLACSYSLMQQCDLAAEALNTAINLGYKDFDWMARDPDLIQLREHAGYKRIQARVRCLCVKET
jgi:tetratricopeptide (TPR) repeat protein